MEQPTQKRLNKHLAFHLGLSRRQADELIQRGSVSVNGHVAPIGARLSDGDSVTVNGKAIDNSTQYIYLAFHKPVGYVCSRKRQGDNPTIYELLDSKYHTLKPVGRLDRDSSGIILLTNDGDFAQRMTHPRYAKTKRYEVALNKALEPLHQQIIGDFGVDLDDGKSKLGLERRDDTQKEWTVIMTEGRNRQIRRTFAALDYTVVKLHRTNFGNYALGSLAEGAYETVSA